MQIEKLIVVEDHDSIIFCPMNELSLYECKNCLLVKLFICVETDIIPSDCDVVSFLYEKGHIILSILNREDYPDEAEYINEVLLNKVLMQLRKHLLVNKVIDVLTVSTGDQFYIFGGEIGEIQMKKFSSIFCIEGCKVGTLRSIDDIDNRGFRSVDRISDGASIDKICGDLAVGHICGTVLPTTIGSIGGIVNVEFVHERVNIGVLENNVIIGMVYNNVRIDMIRDSASINQMRSNVTVKVVSDYSEIWTAFCVVGIFKLEGNSKVHFATSGVNIGEMCDSSTVVVLGSSIVYLMSDTSCIGKIKDYSTVVCCKDQSTIWDMTTGSRVLTACMNMRILNSDGSCKVDYLLGCAKFLGSKVVVGSRKLELSTADLVIRQLLCLQGENYIDSKYNMNILNDAIKKVGELKKIKEPGSVQIC